MANFFDSIAKIASPLTSVVNGISSLGSSLINRHSQKETNKANAAINQQNNQFNAEQAQINRDFESSEAEKTRHYNSREALAADERARNFALEMFRLENDYNLPVNQMKRLREAGINPMSFTNLASMSEPASAMSTTSPSASVGSSPSGSVASAASPIAMQPLHVQNPLMDIAQIRLANAQANEAEANANDRKAKTPLETKLLEIEQDYKGVQIKGLQQAIETDKAKQNQLLAEATSLYSQADMFNQKVNEIIVNTEYITEQSNVARAELKRMRYENSRMEEYWNAKIGQLVSDINKNNAMKGYYLANEEMVKKQIVGILTDNKSKQIAFEIAKGTQKYNVMATLAQDGQIVIDSDWNIHHAELRGWMSAVGSLFGGLASGIGRIGAAIVK